MKTILLIEDDAMTRSMLDQLLSMEGYRVITAGDGLAGVTILESLTPDLVVLDLMLPQMDGATVLSCIRGSALSHLPVLVATALESGSMLDLVRELGIQGEFFKAKHSFDQLLATINRILMDHSGSQSAQAA